MIVSCSQCGVKLKVDETKIKEGGSKLKCPKCGNIFTVYRPEEPAAAAPPAAPPPPVQAPPRPEAAPAPPPPRPAPPVEETTKVPVEKWKLDERKIVVAHDGDSVLNLIEGILTEGGYKVVTAREGVQAVVALETEKPFLAILDVALPRIYGFEVCDRLKNSEESKAVKVILIASIYDKTRYKREPMSLYGADDYIEKHHIQDCLLDKVRRLARQTSPEQRIVREEELPKKLTEEQQQSTVKKADEMRKDEIKNFSAPSNVDPQQVEAARRFARIILSDIALYNQGAVEEGIRNGNFHEALASELKEGRDLYTGRVPQEIRDSMDYFADEIDKFIEKKRQTMQLGG